MTEEPEKNSHPPLRRNFRWYQTSFLWIIGYLGLIAWATWYPPPPDSAIGILIKDFQGNLIAGFIANLVFLFVAIQLDSKTAQKIDRIEELTETSEAALRRREALLDQEERIAQFEQFIKVQNWHDVRFPKLTTPNHSLGLEYTIRPIRDPVSGPKKRVTEMNSYWLIEVLRPANECVLPKESLIDYSNSPIRFENYYCSFFNGAWHMSLDGMQEWHEFYLSSKLGPVEHGISANSVLGCDSEPAGMNLAVPEFYLVHIDGSELGGGTQSCDRYKIYVDSQNSLFLKINDSPLKAIYLTNPTDTIGDEGYFFKIEKLAGYGDQQKQSNIIRAVESRLSKANVSVPKIPWYRFQ